VAERTISAHLIQQVTEVHTRQARDLLSLPGTLGFKLAGRDRPAMKIPTPALYKYIKLRRIVDYGKISRGGKQDSEYQDLYALQRAQPYQSHAVPKVRLPWPEDEVEGEQVCINSNCLAKIWLTNLCQEQIRPNKA
jgi:hypothetical protein